MDAHHWGLLGVKILKQTLLTIFWWFRALIGNWLKFEKPSENIYLAQELNSLQYFLIW